MWQSVENFMSSLVFGIVAVFGINIGTEEPRYVVVDSLGDSMEVRQYPVRLAAEVTVNDSTTDAPSRAAFEMLAGYIFGANSARRGIAMTAPVEMQPQGQPIAMTAPVELSAGPSSMTMRFFMPASYARSDLPEPSDPRVALVEVPASSLAVITFSGWADRKNETQESKLREALKRTAWTATGPAATYFYNPPWTIPFLRKNELVIPVQRARSP